MNLKVLWFEYESSIPSVAKTDVYIISLLHPLTCLGNDTLLQLNSFFLWKNWSGRVCELWSLYYDQILSLTVDQICLLVHPQSFASSKFSYIYIFFLKFPDIQGKVKRHSKFVKFFLCFILSQIGLQLNSGCTNY